MILLAVFLFAALSYAVIGSITGSGKSGKTEAASSKAALIMQTGTLVENTISRMKLINGCSDIQISFENSTVSGYTNSNAPSDKRCHVFDPAGGGMSWPETPQGTSESSGALFQFTALPVAGVGPWQEYVVRCVTQSAEIQATCRDLVMILAHVPSDVCSLINGNNGMSSAENENGAVGAINSAVKFVGSYAAGNDDIGLPGLTSFGKTEGCYKQTAGADADKFYYYKVLIAR